MKQMLLVFSALLFCGCSFGPTVEVKRARVVNCWNVDAWHDAKLDVLDQQGSLYSFHFGRYGEEPDCRTWLEAPFWDITVKRGEPDVFQGATRSAQATVKREEGVAGQKP